MVDALRHFMVGGVTFGIATDFVVQLGVVAGLIALAARLYPTLVR